MTIRHLPPSHASDAKSPNQYSGRAPGRSEAHSHRAVGRSLVVPADRANWVGAKRHDPKHLATRVAHLASVPRRATKPRTDHLSTQERQGLCGAWITDAQGSARAARVYERLALSLLALDAPRDLVRAARVASANKEVHVRLCVEIAAACAGRPLDADALGADQPAEPFADLVAATLELVKTGCIGATVGSMAARAAAENCTDLVIRRALRRIVVDDTRHAGFSWSCLKWVLGGGALAAGDTFLAQAVRAALEEEQTSSTIPSPARHVAHERWLGEHGRLSARARAAVSLTTLRDVVVPCARALLDEIAGRRASVDVA